MHSIQRCIVYVVDKLPLLYYNASTNCSADGRLCWKKPKTEVRRPLSLPLVWWPRRTTVVLGQSTGRRCEVTMRSREVTMRSFKTRSEAAKLRCEVAKLRCEVAKLGTMRSSNKTSHRNFASSPCALAQYNGGPSRPSYTRFEISSHPVVTTAILAGQRHLSGQLARVVVAPVENQRHSTNDPIASQTRYNYSRYYSRWFYFDRRLVPSTLLVSRCCKRPAKTQVY